MEADGKGLSAQLPRARIVNWWRSLHLIFFFFCLMSTFWFLTIWEELKKIKRVMWCLVTLYIQLIYLMIWHFMCSLSYINNKLIIYNKINQNTWYYIINDTSTNISTKYLNLINIILLLLISSIKNLKIYLLPSRFRKLFCLLHFHVISLQKKESNFI